MTYDQPLKKLFFELVSWLPIAVLVWASLFFRKWSKQVIACGRWLSCHVSFLVLILISPPTDMAHAVLLGTGICGRFSLLMRGGLLTRIPSLLGLCEIKTKRGLQFHAFFFFLCIHLENLFVVTCEIPIQRCYIWWDSRLFLFIMFTERQNAVFWHRLPIKYWERKSFV